MSQVGAAEFSGAASADVAHTDGDACTVRRKVGRPPRLDREMIARAASEIGLDHVTMKAVAEKLGVSVPALYHHVDGRADLMQLATEYSTRVMQLPADRGQHWAEWLMEWVRYAFETFTEHPEFLYQVQRGVFGVDRMVVQVDAMIATLTAQGFNEVDALEAWNLANRVAVGASVNAIRQRDLANDRVGSYHRVLADRASDELPNLRRLVNALEQSPPRTLDDEIATALIGIAVQRGEPWEPILDFRRQSHAATREPTAH